MRKFAIAVALASAAFMSPAYADLVLVGGTVESSFTDLGADGFGHAPRLLTLQTNTIESGSGTPVSVANGDAISGADKTSTPTLSALGWTSGGQVGIGFNSDQTGQTGVTLDTLTLTIFNGTTALQSFNLAAPINFTAAELALQQGNGNAVFNFALTAAEQAIFNNILAESGSAGFFAGVAATLGCAAGASPSCMPTNDGPDSFLGFAQGEAVATPVPSSAILFGTGLILTGWLSRRRQRVA